MKKILIFFIFGFTTSFIYSQDLIITNEGDSLNCKITKVKSDFIYFTFKYKEEIRNTLLPVTDIKEHQFDFYHTSEIPAGKIMGYDNYQHFRIIINEGYSHQTAKIADSVPEDFKDYVKGLKSGYHFGGEMIYYFTEQLGFGMKYYMYKSSNSLDNIYVEDIYGNRTYGELKDDLSVSYIGPTFSTRLLSMDKRNALILNVSLGYMGYSNDKIIIDEFKMTSSTMGMALDFGYDLRLYQNLSLGFQVSLISGTLVNYDWDNGTTVEKIELQKGEFESLNRIDFSVGLRFCK